MRSKLQQSLPLFFFSPWAQAAANIVAWKSYLAIVMGIALISAIFLSRRNQSDNSRLAKILLTGLYFWVITFAQLIILALVYHFSR